MDSSITNDSGRIDSHVTSRRRTPSEEIAFATGQSTLGTVLVARGSRGICAIFIGTTTEELTADLAAQFPKSALVWHDGNLDGDLEKILRFIETPAQGLDLELDIRGTPFQHRVWDALCAIPTGRTITYAALARRIGEPGSARAVANACAANAIALAIPCHRVIRSDGTHSGYRWGIERQRALIAREALA
jgi:methylated-DNA-[protein]-cysteine S-methyltransferase/AraC family transcriptional regulator of adaptative response/methylated-DNA-[protein]-cysteine methyltransferase